MSAQFSMNWHCNMAEGREEGDDPLYLIGDDEMCFAFAEVTGEDWDSCEARARLMTAAPKLLRALDEAENFIVGFEDDEMQQPLVGKLLARIRTAKAAGGSP